MHPSMSLTPYQRQYLSSQLHQDIMHGLPKQVRLEASLGNSIVTKRSHGDIHPSKILPRQRHQPWVTVDGCGRGQLLEPSEGTLYKVEQSFPPVYRLDKRLKCMS